jgi:hypothetical protein
MNGRAYTAEDDAVLRQLIGHQSYETIGAVLGRSASSVHGRAKLLGITPGPRRGEQHHAARLSALQAGMIGALADCGYTAAEIKQAFGLEVSAQAIRDIGRGSTWGRA